MSQPPVQPPTGWVPPAPGTPTPQTAQTAQAAQAALPPQHGVWSTPAGVEHGPRPTPPAPGTHSYGGPYAGSYAGTYAGSYAGQYGGPHPPASRSGGSLAVWLAGSALVVALVALVVALLALFAPMGMSAPGDVGAMSSGDGTVPGAVVGQQLSGDRIAYAAVDALLAAGAEVDPGAITCETLLRLDEGSTSNCHGTVDGDTGWTGTMEFSGAPGEFSLHED